jgi:translation initiation factor IF-3
MRRFRPERKVTYLRVNQRIRFPKLRVIASDGSQVGVISRDEALRMAREEGLDLVEVVPNSRPPVCKIMDYGKYKYEKNKSEKHRHKASVIKEVKLGMNTQEADVGVKLRWARDFLSDGNKVRARLRFRGREIIYAKRGKDILLDFARSLDDVAMIEQPPRVDGNIATIVVAPRKKDAQTEDKQSGKEAV